jgi:hypothetical protein
MSPAQLAQLPEAQRNAFTAMPAWLWATFGVATITALAASICLLLRRAWAVPLFAISLVAVLTQYGWVFGVYRILRTMPVEEAAGLPVAIIVIALLSLWLARFATKKGWLA